MDEALIRDFIENGFVCVREAFPREVADECRAILWRDTGCDPDDPSTWTEQVVRLWHYDLEPFRKAAGGSCLHTAFDAVAGKGRWMPRTSLGSFPVRFPAPGNPIDDHWHVDPGFEGDDPADKLAYRTNVFSKNRLLLLLFLFSDVGEDDAPTRIRIGSHLDVAALLEPEGEAGLPVMDLARRTATATAHRPVALATGRAGDVYLCHPFAVHAAQRHRGTEPRFMAQPPLHPAEPVSLDREEGDYSPVETAILRGLGR